MVVQIVKFQLKGIDEERYAALAEELAPTFAQLPGLVAKLWLADGQRNTYGGAYVWQDREAADAYLAGPVFAAARANPALDGLQTELFETLAGPTEVSAGFIAAAVAGAHA